MSGLLAWLMMLTAAQGEAVVLTMPADERLVAVEVVWNERSIPLVANGGQWSAVLGIDLDTPAGEQDAELQLTYIDGTTTRQTCTVSVTAKSFPTTWLTVEPKYVELSAENKARSAREREEISAIYDRLTPQAYWSETFQAPIPGVTGGRNFGHRRIFNDQPRAPHSGVDLTATTGTPVKAANRGRVVLSKNLFFSGNAVFIDHGLGVYSVYLHLSEISVETGAMVEQGQVIGRTGATGRVTGPHLHWGVRVLDARVDPFSLLDIKAPVRN